MRWIELRGKTLKGKNRVREHGTRAEILKGGDIMPFSLRPGPWFLIRHGSDLRWIHGTDDTDFDWEAV